MPSTLNPIGQVRLLINDPAGSDPVFSDIELRSFLDMEDDSVKRAAAQALEVIADDELLTSKVIRTQDLATNGAAVAAQLRARAAQLRSEAVQSSGSARARGSFPPAPCLPDPALRAGRAW